MRIAHAWLWFFRGTAMFWNGLMIRNTIILESFESSPMFSSECMKHYNNITRPVEIFVYKNAILISIRFVFCIFANVWKQVKNKTRSFSDPSLINSSLERSVSSSMRGMKSNEWKIIGYIYSLMERSLAKIDTHVLLTPHIMVEEL